MVALILAKELAIRPLAPGTQGPLAWLFLQKASFVWLNHCFSIVASVALHCS